MRQYINKIFIFIAALALSVTSCVDELDAPAVDEIIEGKPALIAINTGLGDMDIVSRAAMTAGKDKEINSIWLGFFRASDRRLVLQKTYGEQTTIGSGDLDFRTLDDIELSSGQYLIAAVANPRGNYGVMHSVDGTYINERTELITLLTNHVATFDDYLGIAFMRGRGQTSGAIDTPTGNLPMQGIFIPGNNAPHPLSSDAVYRFANQATYIAPTAGSIPVTLDGVLHFRRLVSRNTFNITYDHKLIKSFEIIQARVFNVPVVSWVAERGDGSLVNGFDETNAGDYTDIIGKSASTDKYQAKAQPNYLPSPNINPADIQTDGKGRYTFDWWQLENRRRALFIDDTDTGFNYSGREEERKTADGLNTGIYTALSGTSGDVPPNNCATYVQLVVQMEMTDTPENQLTENSKLTTVDAFYTIHLGYCEGADNAQKASDYACRRNTQYTYNVEVLGVNKIIVEAQKEDVDYEHGAEGTVTLVTTEYFEADAHYAAYNVALSNRERADAEWVLRVYTDASTPLDINSKNHSGFASKYYNWIELRATSGENILAPYKPVEGTGADGGTFRLTDLHDLNKYPPYNKKTSADDETVQWYTVFLNEYVYEDNYHSDTSADWAKYINLPPRLFWLKVKEFRSEDEESVIINSKYAFRQNSIQSFYSSTNPASGIVMGLETVNEFDGIPLMMHGDNMQTSYSWNGTYSATTKGKTPSGSDASEMNYNYFLNNNAYNISRNGNRWASYISNFTSGVAPMIDGQGNPNGLMDIRNLGSFYTYYDKQGARQYDKSRALAEACLNRNRDLNGNGIIDQNEIRWMVPIVDQYIRLVLGSAALRAPLINFNDLGETAPWTGTQDYHAKARYHYGSIESNQLWAEEGVSTGWLQHGQCPNPQQVRCIRYLGNDYSAFPKQTEFTLAINKASGQDQLIFNYSDESIRSASSEPLPPHLVRDAANWNRPPHRLAYKTEDIKISDITSDVKSSDSWFEYLSDGNNPCDKYNINGQSGWRVPNQVEMLALLFTKDENGKALLNSHDYLSCTKEFFSPFRVMGADANHGFALNDGNVAGGWVKCVRDIE